MEREESMKVQIEIWYSKREEIKELVGLVDEIKQLHPEIEFEVKLLDELHL